ncbi:hypothetical protein GOBAR_DD32744 [Gossypium barbadense]|nr:hypothetical protein GOBAR_DD32744 [Gossypium barbadense]
MDPNPNILLNDNNHIAKNVNKDQYRIVRPRLHDPGYFPDRRVLPYLNIAGFGVAAEAVIGLGKVLDLWGTCKQLLGRVPPTMRKDD